MNSICICSRVSLKVLKVNPSLSELEPIPPLHVSAAPVRLDDRVCRQEDDDVFVGSVVTASDDACEP